MPYATNSIGGNSFADISGAILYRQEQIEIINRPGVDGSGLRQLGARGEPFVLTTRRFHADFAAAATALQTYDNLNGSLVTLIRNGVDHGFYYVLEVKEIATVAVLNPTGNVPASTDTVLQTLHWKLLG